MDSSSDAVTRRSSVRWKSNELTFAPWNYQPTWIPYNKLKLTSISVPSLNLLSLPFQIEERNDQILQTIFLLTYAHAGTLLPYLKFNLHKTVTISFCCLAVSSTLLITYTPSNLVWSVLIMIFLGRLKENDSAQIFNIPYFSDNKNLLFMQTFCLLSGRSALHRL